MATKHKKGCTFEKQLAAAAVPTPPPAPPDPAREAAEIIDMLGNLRWDLERDVDAARDAHELSGARLLHVAGKAKRILSGHCRTAAELRDMLDEKWEDSIIRPLLAKALSGPSWREGATDQQIADALWKTYKGVYNWPKFVRAELGSGYGQKAGIIKSMSISVGGNRYGDKPLAELKGLAVIAAARRLLKIPQPTKTTPPAKAATPAAGKKPAPKKPAAKASPKPAPAGVAFRKQTFGQWMATARGALGVPKLDESDPRYTTAYLAGERPADAARRIRGEGSSPAPTAGKPTGVEAASNLMASLRSHQGADDRWARLKREGATDAQLKTQIAESFGIGGGGPGYSHRGGVNPAFWDGGDTLKKPTLSGKALVDAVRQLMVIPQPAATPAAPTKTIDIDVDVPLPVVEYIQSLHPEDLLKYARYKWFAHVEGDQHAKDALNLPPFDQLKMIDKFAVEDRLEELAKGEKREWHDLAATSKVERRANAIAKAVDKPEPEPLVHRASAPVPIADVLSGVTAKDLREAYSYETLTTGRVRRVFVDAARDCWVVMGMHLESDTFSLMPCVPIDRYPGPTESWHARRKHKLTPGQKPRFEGVTFAEQDSERLYVFTDEANQVNVIARPAAAPAARKAGAA